MNKFSKDPKSRLISIEEFLENSDYLSDAKKTFGKDKHQRNVLYIINLHQNIWFF